MKLYKVINAQTNEVVRHREANRKRQASSGKVKKQPYEIDKKTLKEAILEARSKDITFLDDTWEYITRKYPDAGVERTDVLLAMMKMR